MERTIVGTWAAVFLMMLTPPTYGLVGYDCNSTALNTTVFSLQPPEPCQYNGWNISAEDVKIQLLQLSEYDQTMVSQCKLEIDRTVYYCGMHSHTSVVLNGRAEYLREISKRQCLLMIAEGVLTIENGLVIGGLKTNNTETRSITLAGHVSQDGSCRGTQYSDSFGTWDNVIVQGIIRITLQTHIASIKLKTNEILLKTGVSCPLGEGYCIDADGSHTFWESRPIQNCDFDRYQVLYEGSAKRMEDALSPQHPKIYTVTSRDITFALTQMDEEPVCGYRLIVTEHPRLFILEHNGQQTFAAKRQLTADNIDIFAYMNTKFIYLEKHLKSQLLLLYQDVVKQRCDLERQFLDTAVGLAASNPEEFAYRIMKGPGHLAAATGETVHIFKCIPVTVQYRHTKDCYQELPIFFRNQSYFLTPRTRIITGTGSRRDCNPLLPSQYYVDNRWLSVPGTIHQENKPQRLRPTGKPGWTYTDASSLATSGIYSQEDLNKLKEHLFFAKEKETLVHHFAREAMGKDTPGSSVSMLNFLDEKTLDHLAETTGKKLWNGFLRFGQISSGIIGILAILALIRVTISTVIRGYALHSLYGCGAHILAAIWGACTHLVIVKKKQRQYAIAEHTYVEMGNRADHVATRQPQAREEQRRSLDVDQITV